MLQNLAQDLRLYLRLIMLQLRAQLQYRVHLTIDIGAYLFVTLLEFVAVWLYLLPFRTLLGWQIGDIALLIALMSLSFGLAEMVGAGIDEFSSTIRRGEFDRVLLRPVGVFTQVIGSDFRLRRLGRITQGIFVFCFALTFLPSLHWTAAKVCAMVLGILSGATIFVSILLLGATVCFWTVETTELTNILTYGSRDMLSYPMTIYNQTMQRFFLFIVPVSFSSYVPACYILERALPFGLPPQIVFVAPVAALLFAALAGVLWRIGVRHYQSTGS